jgi:uncharacterized protein (TIGR02301 family)
MIFCGTRLRRTPAFGLWHRFCGRMAVAVLVASLVAPAALPSPARAEDAPYSTTLLRLAEILGALHHLRPLCGAAEQRVWRDRMSNILASEFPSNDMRQRLIARFNRSYRDLSTSQTSCTPAARELIDRYLAEGERITTDIVAKYGKTPEVR